MADDFHIPLGNGHAVPVELARDLWNHLAAKQGNEKRLSIKVSNALTAKGWHGCSRANISSLHAKGWPPRRVRKPKQKERPLDKLVAKHLDEMDLNEDIKQFVDDTTADAALGQMFNREVLKAGLALAQQIQKKPHILVLMGKEMQGLMDSFANVATKVHMLGDPLLKMVPAEPDKTIDVTPNPVTNGHAIEESPLVSHFRNAKVKAVA